MHERNFFKKSISSKVRVGGPTPEDQLMSMVQNKYWTVLNTKLLVGFKHDKLLTDRVNAFKHALQTYGPHPTTGLPDLIQNKGKAGGSVFHGHIYNSNGTMYVLEWTLLDKDRRIIALLGFDTHENYKFQQTPLRIEDCQKILSNPYNMKILAHVEKKIIEAKAKAERMDIAPSPHHLI